MQRSQGKKDSVMRRIPLLLSLSAILLVFGIIALSLLVSIMRIQHEEKSLWREQSHFDISYKKLIKGVMREDQASSRFAMAFDTDSLQAYSDLNTYGGQSEQHLPSMERYSALPGVAQALGDFAINYDTLKDIHTHTISLILHGFSIPEQVMPPLMQDYRLANNELKLTNNDKISYARDILFDHDTRAISSQVWENLYAVNLAAHRYFSDRIDYLSQKFDKRLMILMALVITMLVTVLVSLWLKMSEVERLQKVP